MKWNRTGNSSCGRYLVERRDDGWYLCAKYRGRDWGPFPRKKDGQQLAERLGAPLGLYDVADSPRRFWCGPTAVASLLGLPYDFAEDLFRDLRDRSRQEPTLGLSFATGRIERMAPPSRFSGGVYLSEMMTVLDSLGLGIKRQVVLRRKPPSLSAWIKTERPSAQDVYLVNVTRHYMVVQGNRVVDSYAENHISEHPNRFKRVRKVYKVRDLRGGE